MAQSQEYKDNALTSQLSEHRKGRVALPLEDDGVMFSPVAALYGNQNLSRLRADNVQDTGKRPAWVAGKAS